MANLTPAQETRLANVYVADQAWRKAKTDAHATLRAAIEHEIAGRAAQRDMEVRLAFDAGVSKAKINKEGLGTSNPGTVTDSLARTESTMAAIVGRVEPALVTRFSLTDPITSEEQEGFWEYLLNVDMAGPDYEAWLPTLAKTHFRYDAADRHKASFRVGTEGLSLRSIERGDRSTMNKFDLAVTGWLATAGKAEAAAWLAENLHDTRPPRVEEEMEE